MTNYAEEAEKYFLEGTETQKLAVRLFSGEVFRNSKEFAPHVFQNVREAGVNIEMVRSQTGDRRESARWIEDLGLELENLKAKRASQRQFDKRRKSSITRRKNEKPVADFGIVGRWLSKPLVKSMT